MLRQEGVGAVVAMAMVVVVVVLRVGTCVPSLHQHAMHPFDCGFRTGGGSTTRAGSQPAQNDHSRLSMAPTSWKVCGLNQKGAQMMATPTIQVDQLKAA